MGLWVIGAAWAGEGGVDALVGLRTAPDAALEQPSEWVPGEVEPTALAAIVGRYRGGEAVWWGVDGQLWGYLPEPDGDLLALAPRVGFRVPVGPVALGGAARIDGELYPFASGATNLRSEVALTSAIRAGIAELGLTAEGVDRRYVTSAWSFRDAAGTLRIGVAPGSVRASLAGGFQVDQSADGSVGEQLRTTVEVGGGTDRVDVWAAYRLIAAWGGGAESAERPVFTPIGGYAEDADALAAGGFLQHRVEGGATVELGRWQLAGSVLGRLRQVSDGSAGDGIARTVHGRIDLRRELGDHVALVGAAGASAAVLVGGASYVDVYGWTGLGWEL